MRAVHDPDELVAASGRDVFVRWMVDPAAPLTAWAWPGGVAWHRTGAHRRSTLTVVAEVADAARRLPELLDLAGQPPRVTVPLGTLDLLPAQVRGRVVPRVGDDWEWMVTDAAPPAPAVRVERLGLQDEPEVAALLEAASPRRSTEVGDRDVVAWWGVRDPGSGRLLACAAHTEAVAGVPHLASIATHPDARGGGLGTAVTAAATRGALALGRPVVTLGMYSDNAVARRVYHRLGFRCEHRWSSRRLAAPTG